MIDFHQEQPLQGGSLPYLQDRGGGANGYIRCDIIDVDL